jgi:hypothetical protein
MRVFLYDGVIQEQIGSPNFGGIYFQGASVQTENQADQKNKP